MSQTASNGIVWRPLHAWSNAQCEQLASYWRTQLTEFAATWLARPLGDLDVQIAPVASFTGDDPHEVLGLHSAQSLDAGAWLSVRTASGARTAMRAMGTALFGPGVGASAAASAGVACDALDALIRSFGFERFTQHSEVSSAVLQAPWSGALGLSFSLGASQWTLMATATTVGRWLAEAGVAGEAATAFDSRARGELASLRDALAHAKVRLRVRLDGPQLALGTLTDLREGDIVALPHALSLPLHVETLTGEPVCRAYLGQHQEKLAIELSGAPGQFSLQESV